MNSQKQMDKIKDYIQITKVMPDQFCDELIIEMEKTPWTLHSWYDATAFYEGKNPVAQYEKELSVQFCSDEQAKTIIPYVDKALQPYHVKHSGKENLTLFTRLSRIRFDKYEPGTLMRLHIDHIHDIFDGKIKGIPVVSIVGCLNDDFEGADFILCGEKISLKKGDILLFPSNFMYPHQVTEATKGIRYSFVGWVF